MFLKFLFYFHSLTQCQLLELFNSLLLSDSLDECSYGNSDSSSDDSPGCNGIPSPRSMSALYVNKDNIFIYLCAPQGLLVFKFQPGNTNTPLQQLGDSYIGVNFCVQSLPTPYGLYLHKQDQVLYMPFEQFDPKKDAVPSYGLLGSANPDVYHVYSNFVATSSAGSSSSDDSGENTFDLITSIVSAP